MPSIPVVGGPRVAMATGTVLAPLLATMALADQLPLMNRALVKGPQAMEGNLIVPEGTTIRVGH